MRNLLPILSLLLIISCQSATDKKPPAPAEPINEQLYLDLGGESQYVEITSSSKDNPILLFIHGGPAWPQTPQLRYYNAALAEHYTLVIWEQRGAGNSAKQNPEPDNLSLAQIVEDGHQLTNWLQEEYGQKKIYLAGYSWGSLVGVGLATAYPQDYTAYIGIAQVVNMNKGIAITQTWLKEQATLANNTAALTTLDSLSDLSNYEDDLDRFFQQWVLLNQFNGATFNKESEIETEKAMSLYDDYKDYDWFAVWEYSSKRLQPDMYGADLETVKEIAIPVFLLQGRHDWNIPSSLAAAWLEKLEAPQKQLYWFEASGHGPLEEEAENFNEVMIGILEEIE